MTLRAAAPADLPAIAALQTDSWQSAYRGQVPDAFLAREVPRRLAQHWGAWPGAAWRIETAWDVAGLMGFVAVDMAHDGGPYVDNLHVRPDAKGRGAGRALMRAAGRQALADGRLWLTVMRGNGPARGFYGALGGVEGAEITEDLFGQPVQALPVIWDGAALAELAR